MHKGASSGADGEGEWKPPARSYDGAAQGTVISRAAIDYSEVFAVRFYVLLKGEGFTSHLGALSPSVDGQATKFGFYTTRVVDAPDAQRAVELATAQVRQDEKIRASSTERTIVPDEVHRVSWFFRRLRPPRGFTFFLKETEADQ